MGTSLDRVLHLSGEMRAMSSLVSHRCPIPPPSLHLPSQHRRIATKRPGSFCPACLYSLRHHLPAAQGTWPLTRVICSLTAADQVNTTSPFSFTVRVSITTDHMTASLRTSSFSCAFQRGILSHIPQCVVGLRTSPRPRTASSRMCSLVSLGFLPVEQDNAGP